MKRILFVDDDVPVLDSLRMRLRPMSSQWAISFASSGGQALADLQQETYNVIVSDIRMPGMDGVRLLRTVSERWPETVRIALSGYADPQQTLHLAPVAHQFLSKPCEALLLEQTIERCLVLHEVLHQPKLRAVVGRLRRLPALRGTHAKLQAAVANEDVTMHEVAQIIAGDPVVAAKVVQMVNSAFFRRGRRITSIDQAVTYLGLSTVRALSRWARRSPMTLCSPRCCTTSATGYSRTSVPASSSRRARGRSNAVSRCTKRSVRRSVPHMRRSVRICWASGDYRTR
jgi:CheY-like chemotaxis protein